MENREQQFYHGKKRGEGLPLMKDRDEFDDEVTILESEEIRISFPLDPELTFRLKTWTVPLSLETASHWAVEENARL